MSSNSEALPATPGPEGFASPPITIILTAILLVFFFVGFFSIYFCRFFMDGMHGGWFRRTASDNTVNPADAIPTRNGLDPNLIELFPTFTYSKVKELRKEKSDLECAICLAEVADDDLLRLLTVCYHCFHRECIDLWLESHKTCPVCRHDLDLPPEDLEKTNNNATLQFAEENADPQQITNNNDHDEHAINITIHDDEEAANVDEGDNADVKGGILTKLTSEVFSRSHTTGHSLAVGRTGSRDHDKYTLRLLPEHVPADGARGHHGATSSCIAFGEFSSSSSPNPKTSSRSEKIGV